jgi:hypothetical protein
MPSSPRILPSSPSIAGPAQSVETEAMVPRLYTDKAGAPVRPETNWQRGCFRLWVVGSALFIIAIAALTSIEIKSQIEILDSSAPYPTYVWTMLLNGMSVAIGIPVIVLTIGAAVGWAFSGFKAPAPTTSPKLYRGA